MGRIKWAAAVILSAVFICCGTVALLPVDETQGVEIEEDAEALPTYYAFDNGLWFFIKGGELIFIDRPRIPLVCLPVED